MLIIIIKYRCKMIYLQIFIARPKMHFLMCEIQCHIEYYFFDRYFLWSSFFFAIASMCDLCQDVFPLPLEFEKEKQKNKHKSREQLRVTNLKQIACVCVCVCVNIHFGVRQLCVCKCYCSFLVKCVWSSCLALYYIQFIHKPSA